MKFLLDTDTCIYGSSRTQPFCNDCPQEVAVSVITEAELRTGAAKSTAAAKTLRLLVNFLRPLNILEFTSGDAAACAQVRAKLERAAPL
jgi:predicted nucleic acid-binding protein